MKNLLLAIIFLALTGCGFLLPRFPANASPPPQKLYAYSQVEQSIPVTIGVTPTGEKVVVFETRKEFTSNQQVSERELTLWQKFIHLSWWILFLVGAFIFISLYFFAGRPLVGLYQKYQDMKATLKKTVATIKALPQEYYDPLTEKLAVNLDTKDKIVIDQMKAELNKTT